MGVWKVSYEGLMAAMETCSKFSILTSTKFSFGITLKYFKNFFITLTQLELFRNFMYNLYN